MARLEEFDDIQLDVEFTQAATRSNITSEENIAISFGKISKWYEALIPTGGSSGQILAWNSSGTAKWVTNPNTNTTYTFETGDSVGQIKVTPSDGTAYNVNVKNISAGTSTGTINSLAYYSDTTMLSPAQISSGTGLFFKSELNNAETPATLTTLCTYGPTYGNDARSLIGGTQGILSYGDGGPQIDFKYSRTGGHAGSLIFTDNDSVAAGASWSFVSNQADWNVISKRFHARTSISIGTNLPNTGYNLYVNGTTNLTGNTTIGGTLNVVGDITQNGVTVSLSTHTHGLLDSSFAQAASDASNTGWSILGIDTSPGFILKSIRDNTTNTDWMSGDYGSGIAFGGADTRGVISMKWNSPIITFAGGNHNSTNTGPDWYIKISGTSGNTYNFDNYMGAVKIGSFYGMAWPDGTDQDANSWIRTTRAGLIPYARNDDTTNGNVSSLGTSTWTFVNGYISNLYYKDLKPITVVAGNTADNSIDKMAGSYFFQGINLFGNIYDWIGIQAGTNNDKWQLVGLGSNGLMFRENDTGGTNTTSWDDWKGLLIPDNVTGSNGITVTNTTTTYGSGDAAFTVRTGVNITHSNSVTAETTFNKSRFKYDAQGHITESGYYVHTAAGTTNTAGWIKIATMKHLQRYGNTPIMLTLSQRGNLLTYRLHIQFSNNSTTDPPLDKFIISSDEAETWRTVYPRAYMIKTAAGTWDLYIQKKDNYEALAVTEFDVGKYFTDHMSWTWLDVQTADSEITGGTEAERIIPFTAYQSRTANTVLAAPNGSDGTASFRQLVAADIPSLNYAGSSSSGGDATSALALTHKTLDSTTINNTAGSFAFSGNGAPWAGTDWVGLQIGDNNDKFQISATNGVIRVRQNDSGGTNSTNWTSWYTLSDTSFTQTLTSGTDIGSISRNGTAKTIYAPGVGDHLTYESGNYSLSKYCKTITNWNDAGANGWYMGNNATNSPGTDYAQWSGRTIATDANYCIQEAWAFNSGFNNFDYIPHRMRAKINGTWGPWTDQWDKCAIVNDNSADYASYAYHKFAEIELSEAYADRTAVIYVNKTWTNTAEYSGILHVHFRTKSGTNHNAIESAHLYWIHLGKGIDPNDFMMFYWNDTDNNKVRVQLWLKITTRYDGWEFKIFDEFGRVGAVYSNWKLYPAEGNNLGESTPPSDFTGCVMPFTVQMNKASNEEVLWEAPPLSTSQTITFKYANVILPKYLRITYTYGSLVNTKDIFLYGLTGTVSGVPYNTLYINGNASSQDVFEPVIWSTSNTSPPTLLVGIVNFKLSITTNSAARTYTVAINMSTYGGNCLQLASNSPVTTGGVSSRGMLRISLVY